MKKKRNIITYVANPYNNDKKQTEKGPNLDRSGRVWKNDLLVNDITSQRGTKQG